MSVLSPLEKFVLNFVEEKADLLFLVLSPSGLIEQANKAAESRVGYKLAGQAFNKMIIDFQGTFNFESLSRDTTRPHLLNIVNTEGLPLTYYFNFARIDNRIIAIGQQDAQEIDEMRRNLLNLNNDLNNLSRELHKKNVELEKLIAQKNKFFGMASHDLRHPLGIINMYSGFLETEAKDTLNDQHNEFLSYIRKSSNLMKHILDDFLDFAIFQSGRLELHCEQVELIDFIAKIVRYSQPLAMRKDIHLVFIPPSSPVSLILDRAKIEQVVNNLLNNAIKYSYFGGKITVELLSSGTEVIASVRDEGPGISEEDLKRLFLPFERLETRAEGEEKSSGLGLAIVDKIIDAHGGRVWAESKLNEGAVFFVAFPANC